MFPIRDDVPSRHAPVMTVLLIGANTAAFLFAATLPRDQVRELFYLMGIVPARFAHPTWAARVGFPLHDYWPFFTSMFLHGGWLHLIGNMWTLSIFGDNVEDRMGPFRFLGFYLLCGIAAGITHLLTNPSSTVPTVGASGAIAGACIVVGRRAIYDLPTALIGLAAFVLIWRFKPPEPVLIAAGALAGVLIVWVRGV